MQTVKVQKQPKQEAEKPKRTRSLQRFYNFQGWYFIVLALIFLAAFIAYPIGKSLVMTTQSIQGLSVEFVGLQNFTRMLQDNMFWNALGNTFIFLIVQVPIMLMLAMVLASILNSPTVKFRAFYRVAIFLPAVTSLVAYSVLFKMMFAESGIVNKVLLELHIVNQAIPWLNDPFWAKVVIIIALLWRWTGYNMIFFLAGLQNIPQEVYEAAKVDGANAFQRFIYITVPQLKPIILFTGIMSTIGTLQLFDEPMNLTGGGPGTSTMTISQYIYNHSFVYTPNFGYAATLSYVLVMIVAVLAYIQFRVARDKE